MKVMTKILGASLLIATTVGCASKTNTLYQWQDYEPQVYQYLTHDSAPEAQIESLEKGLVQANAQNRQVPPGYHAHLGMLYGQIGKTDQMVQQFKTEQVLYPESAQYMQFLLRNYRQE